MGKCLDRLGIRPGNSRDARYDWLENEKMCISLDNLGIRPGQFKRCPGMIG